MKTKKKKYLPLYEKWMEKGLLPNNGLCNSLPNKEYLRDLFEPTYEECVLYRHLSGHWGSTLDEYSAGDAFYNFNEFRQTVVLFLAAMNEEL